MENTDEQPSFNLESTVEQQPFEDATVQTVFSEWCKVNDGIEPAYIDRSAWENRTGDDKILEDREDGKKNLYLPKDLQLWEMVDVMEAVDTDTFSENLNRQTSKAEELRQLGEKFSNAGIYIAQRLDSLDEGRNLAKGLAVQFYDYGRSLATGTRPETSLTTDELSHQEIPADKVADVDRWLAGKNFYQEKMAKVDSVVGDDDHKRDALLEQERRKTLAQYFRVAEKSFALHDREQSGNLIYNEDTKPWEANKGVHDAFLDKSESQMKREIEKPKTELKSSIFRGGMELLQRNLPIDKLPDFMKENIQNWENADIKLREELDIDGMKELLNRLREEGNTDEISEYENIIAERIQLRVALLPRNDSMQNPSDILANQEINCVGASMLGGAFLSELGIDYYVADLPSHSILFLKTRSGEVKYLDMLDFTKNHTLTNDVISGNKSDSTPITVNDIANFSQERDSDYMTFSLNSDEYNQWLMEEQLEHRKKEITLFKPEIGQQFQLAFNTSLVLSILGESERAVELLRQADTLIPNMPNVNIALGDNLAKLDNTEEGIALLQKAILIDDKIDYAYGVLGREFLKQGRTQDALEAVQKALELNQNSDDSYLLLGRINAKKGQHEDAEEAYKKVIELSPENSDGYYYLGDTLIELDKADEAIENFEHFISIADEKKDEDKISHAREMLSRLRSS